MSPYARLAPGWTMQTVFGSRVSPSAPSSGAPLVRTSSKVCRHTLMRSCLILRMSGWVVPPPAARSSSLHALASWPACLKSHFGVEPGLSLLVCRPRSSAGSSSCPGAAASLPPWRDVRADSPRAAAPFVPAPGFAALRPGPARSGGLLRSSGPSQAAQRQLQNLPTGWTHSSQYQRRRAGHQILDTLVHRPPPRCVPVVHSQRGRSRRAPSAPRPRWPSASSAEAAALAAGMRLARRCLHPLAWARSPLLLLLRARR